MLVVAHHAGRAVTANWPVELTRPGLWLFGSEKLIEAGAVGVDIFFLISGFIMVYVSPPYRTGRRPAGDFLIRRLIRIYPMYAITTLFIVLIAAFHFFRHHDAGEFPFTARRILAA